MAVSLIRLLILYALVLVCMRLMGRRQIGELQTSELVITILLSQIASIPLENNDIPLLNSATAILVLTALEILFSALALKSQKLRKLMQGNPIAVIRDGTVDQKAMKKLRITVDDLLEALREKDIFDPSEAAYAILESNGKLSVLQKPANQGMPCPVVYDGEIQRENFSLCGMTEAKLQTLLQQSKIPLSEILLLTADKTGTVTCIRKEKTS